MLHIWQDKTPAVISDLQAPGHFSGQVESGVYLR